MSTPDVKCESDNTYVGMLSGDRGEEPPGERRCRLLKQGGLAVMVTIAHFSLGASLTWPSPALSSMALSNSTLVGTELVLTKTQMDMTGSLLCLGMLLGSWVAGVMVKRGGRLWTLQVTVGIMILGWLVLALAPTPSVLLVARLLLGMAVGSCGVAGTLYVMEMVDTAVRGSVGALTALAVVLGGLYTVSIGYALHWHYLALACTLPPVVLLINTFFLPRSPSFLIVQGNRLEGVKVMRRLRGPYADLASEIDMIEKMNSRHARGGWNKLLNWKVAKRLVVVVMLYAFQHFCGNYVFFVHTARILRSVGTPLDPDMTTIFVALTRVLGTVVSIYCVERMGRRYCLVASHALNSVTLIILGICVYLLEGTELYDDTVSRLSWVPLVCVLLVMFAINIGAHPVPYILGAEYFPTSIRGQAYSLTYSSGTMFATVVLQTFSSMEAALSMAGLYWCYAAVSCVAVAFTFIFVEETKGKCVG